MTKLIQSGGEYLEQKIYQVRGQKVMLDSDLAELYGVETKRLNEQVTRNIERFPADFMLQLTIEEANTLRSQIATLPTGSHFRHKPRVFTEHGIFIPKLLPRTKEARMKSTVLTTTPDAIERKIFVVRGHRVMLDSDLAELYEVKTKALKQAVKRNITRFPDDFMFELSVKERDELVTICDLLRKSLKHSSVLPMAFTEHGVVMLSSVLRSERAIEVNIQITRAFVKLRKLIASHEEIARKLQALEKTVRGNSADIKLIFATINSMLNPKAKKKPQIGFKPVK